MDPFRVVQWMNDALDAVRCEEWNAAQAAARAARPRPEGKRGRPAKGELPPEEVRALEEEAASIKGSRYALVKNPEDLTDGQRARLEALEKGRLAAGQGLGAQGGPAGRLPGSRRLRGRRAARRLDAQGRLLQDRQGRRRGEEGTPPARRHHRRSRARHQQRARRGHQQQDQGGGEDGLRLPQPDNLVALLMSGAATASPSSRSPGEGEEEGREGSEERCCLG